MPSELFQRFVSSTSMASLGTNLPAEITLEIARLVTGEHQRISFVSQQEAMEPLDLSKSPYYTPPAECLLTKMLPAEVRRQVLGYCLPGREVVYHPDCEDDWDEAKAGDEWGDQNGRAWGDGQTLGSQDSSRRHRRVAVSSNGKKKPTPRGPITDLMVLNKSICSDISRVLYEERFFTIHVHEGLTDGGVEFLQAGRQPLQMSSSVYDQRFPRFTKDSIFGFDRLKKIRIQIHPAKNTECRHTAINTYFINLALCQLLQRREEERITSIVIEFAKPKPNFKFDGWQQVGRRAIQRAEQYWWDPDAQKPRETSMYNAPDIEVVLLPFANLTACHNVQIILPPKLAEHERTRGFVEKLCAGMRSKVSTGLIDEVLERNIEKARTAMEDHVEMMREGRKVGGGGRMTEWEVMEVTVNKDRGERKGVRKHFFEDDVVEIKATRMVVESDDFGFVEGVSEVQDEEAMQRESPGRGLHEQVFVASTMEEAGFFEHGVDPGEFDDDFDLDDEQDQDGDDEAWFGCDLV